MVAKPPPRGQIEIQEKNQRPEEKQNKENIEKKVEKLTETKNKFSLLKDEMPKTTTEKAPLTRRANLKLQDQPKKEEEAKRIGETNKIKITNKE